MTYQLALFGHPVKHSQSPQIHQKFARQFDLAIHYQLIDVSADDLSRRVHDFFEQGGHGANVTVPHKQQVIAVVDHLTERAQNAEAVNTLFKKNGQLWGDNTDGEGLINDFKQKNIVTKNKRLLIIGAGGAVQGILPSLLSIDPETIYIHNRTEQKAQNLAAQSSRCQVLNDTQSRQPFDVIINGTSIGHRGHSPDLNPDWIYSATTAYDLSYGTAAESFLTKAKSFGIQKTHDGLGMLHHQAALGFNLWFNHRPDLLNTELY